MTGPKLLFDENLSPRLTRLLADAFPGNMHVDDVGLHGCADDDVWHYAGKHNFVLVSKDNDFRQLSFLCGAPPKVTWLHIGNGPTSAVVELLAKHVTDMNNFAQDPDTALLTLRAEREYP